MIVHLLLLMTLMILYSVSKRWKYRHLGSPKIFLPFIGHIEMMSKDFILFIYFIGKDSSNIDEYKISLLFR